MHNMVAGVIIITDRNSKVSLAQSVIFELLLGLDHPEVPLHNNGSESDIREYLNDRVAQAGKIPHLSQLVLNKATVPG